MLIKSFRADSRLHSLKRIFFLYKKVSAFLITDPSPELEVTHKKQGGNNTSKDYENRVFETFLSDFKKMLSQINHLRRKSSAKKMNCLVDRYVKGKI